MALEAGVAHVQPAREEAGVDVDDGEALRVVGLGAGRVDDLEGKDGLGLGNDVDLGDVELEVVLRGGRDGGVGLDDRGLDVDDGLAGDRGGEGDHLGGDRVGGEDEGLDRVERLAEDEEGHLGRLLARVEDAGADGDGLADVLVGGERGDVGELEAVVLARVDAAVTEDVGEGGGRFGLGLGLGLVFGEASGLAFGLLVLLDVRSLDGIAGGSGGTISGCGGSLLLLGSFGGELALQLEEESDFSLDFLVVVSLSGGLEGLDFGGLSVDDGLEGFDFFRSGGHVLC